MLTILTGYTIIRYNQVWGSVGLNKLESDYRRITCLQIEHISYSLIFTTLNGSSNLITIISWDYLNVSLANE